MLVITTPTGQIGRQVHRTSSYVASRSAEPTAN
jgi:hypothetical protein